MIRMWYKSLMVITALLIAHSAHAQYPKMTSEVRKEAAEYIEAAKRRSNEIWQQVLPIIEENSRNGKPFIPHASRPTDLPQADIPAFPGAEGGGKYTFGGRGGKVYVVTSLADSGPGTLREACEKAGPRIVVFNVAGKIKLESPLIIRAPYITIAGQSAPGDGVVVAGETVWVDTHDVVIRHMRFRRGETHVGRRDDAIGGNPIGNIMIDHVSASWGLDENMSIYRHIYNDSTGGAEKKFGTVNITIQNSIFSEALDTWNHSLGSTLGGENCSFMRNLWANNAGRNPSIGWNGIFNFANNVVYNWAHRSVDGGDYTAQYNIINNYFKPGPVTPKDSPVGYRILKPEAGRSNLDYKEFGRIYAFGNVVEGHPEVTYDNWNGGIQFYDIDSKLATGDEYEGYMLKSRVTKPLPMPEMNIMTTQEAYDYVLANAGATLPRRDPVDERIIKEVKQGHPDPLENVELPEEEFEHRRLPKDSYKMGIITDISQVGGYPEYKGEPYVDSDNDGIPDDIEIKMGLDPNNPNDSAEISESGYSYIEIYLNNIVGRKE
ncbi:MAG TPA: hypothetical protein VK076_09160 [Candidatus Sphingobacterium stercoripullorum]|nr:hypothetical protein [Candidatus Sphingobacterium stercoripullorum]